MNGHREWFYRQPGPRPFTVTGDIVRKADEAMARMAQDLCPLCGRSLNEDGRCVCEEA